MHFAEGSLMPWLLMKLVFSLLPERSPALVRPLVRGISSSVDRTLVVPQLEKLFRFLEDELSGAPFVAGSELTAADVQMSFPLEAAASRIDLERYPNIKRYVERLHSRPAYARALERGGPYAYA